jgi:MYXO-CTERM domain-containing protein
VTLTATVTSPHATPAGTVTFKDGDVVLGTASLAGGVATLTTRTLVKGDHPITVEYGGTSAFAAGATAAPFAQVVENTPPVAGSGTALAFGPGAAARAVVDAAPGTLDLDAGTVELWFRAGWTDPAEVGTTATLLRLGDADAPRLLVTMAPDRQALSVTVGAEQAPSGPAAGDGSWHHLAMVSDGDATTMSLDGKPFAAVEADLAGGPAGGALVLGEGFVGAIDEVRLWSVARTPDQLDSDARRPLHGDEPGLAGYWRFDEGSGDELFDASPAHLDGAIAYGPPPADPECAFTASAAWRIRDAWQERALDPVHAGYDADGDAITLTVAVAPAHGDAGADPQRLEVGYRPASGYLGTDLFTFALDDGASTSSYEIEVRVSRILACSTDADCGGGDLCMMSACVAPDELTARASGCGCTSAGGAPALWALLALALAPVRLSRRSGKRATNGRRVALAGALALAATTARAGELRGFALQTFEPASPGDRFFFTPDPTADGHLQPMAGLTLAWAVEPLVLVRNGREIPAGDIDRRQFWGFVQASLPVNDAVLLDVSVPAALYQSGNRPLAGLQQIESSALGDVRIGARAPFATWRGARLAAGLDVWLPTGSRAAFASDGSMRALPKAIAGGRLGAVEYGGELGLLLRSARDLGYTRIGPAIAWSAAAAWRFGAFRAGPEVFGRYQVEGSGVSPAEFLLGGHWNRGPWDVGFGLGSGFNRAPGAAPIRMVTGVTWRPGSWMPARTERPMTVAHEPAAAPPQPEPERAPAPAPVPVAEPPPAALPAVAADPVRPPAAQPPAEASAPALTAQARRDLEGVHPIRFENDKDVIRPESEGILRELASLLSRHPEFSRVRVEGHTDSKGSRGHNTRLSDRRAAAVREWLVGIGGVDAARLEAHGYGPSQPVADNHTEEGRARNRRVEFRIVE